ncbi:MAG: Xaa-Pro peptidase family protein [Candidatus Bipolaricaulota bacterium]
MDQEQAVCGRRRNALLESLGGKAFVAYNYEHSDRATLRYLTGFTGEGALVLAPRSAVLLTDSRYTEQARGEVGDVEVVESREWMAKDLATTLLARELDTVVFAARRVTYSWFDTLRKLGSFTLFDMPDPTLELRAVKSEEEVGVLRQAARLADEALRALLPEIRVGANEADLALRLEGLLRAAGSEGVAFETNVSAGPNSALNHYNPSLGRRELQRGDLLLFDFGACVGGYRSDLTRTFCVGRASRQAAEIYDVVLRANEAGIRAVTAGAPGVAVDTAARQVIVDAGFGERFGHGLGHGVGLEVHERPALGPFSKDVLSAGMVTTVEPGIYIPGFGGVRIEDDVVVTATGCEVLTSFPKDRLLEVGT